jgi:hypothetical protein
VVIVINKEWIIVLIDLVVLIVLVVNQRFDFEKDIKNKKLYLRDDK